MSTAVQHVRAQHMPLRHNCGCSCRVKQELAAERRRAASLLCTARSVQRSQAAATNSFLAGALSTASPSRPGSAAGWLDTAAAAPAAGSVGSRGMLADVELMHKSGMARLGSSSSSRCAVHGMRPGSPQITSRSSSVRPASAPGESPTTQQPTSPALLLLLLALLTPAVLDLKWMYLLLPTHFLHHARAGVRRLQ